MSRQSLKSTRKRLLVRLIHASVPRLSTRPEKSQALAGFLRLKASTPGSWRIWSRDASSEIALRSASVGLTFTPWRLSTVCPTSLSDRSMSAMDCISSWSSARYCEKSGSSSRLPCDIGVPPKAVPERQKRGWGSTEVEKRIAASTLTPPSPIYTQALKQARKTRTTLRRKRQPLAHREAVPQP
eukprot:scaffold6941_cov214-Pinguiococcus_pyrenoidosus.AAC.5